jgi:hypothetical protein
MAVIQAAADGARRYLARPDIFHLHGVTGAMAVKILAALLIAVRRIRLHIIYRAAGPISPLTCPGPETWTPACRGLGSRAGGRHRQT